MDDLLNNLSTYVDFQTPSLGVIIAALLALLLLFLSGFASGSEIAFFSLTPNDIDELDADKYESDKYIQILRTDSERTLATILITNNLVNVTIVMLSNYVLGKIILFKVAWLELVCVTVLLTFLLLLFGEIMPKVYSRLNPLKFCRNAAKSIMLLRKLFWPVENIHSVAVLLLEKWLFRKRTDSYQLMSWNRHWSLLIKMRLAKKRRCCRESSALWMKLLRK